jgi:sugar porter (SP) family MFS transporter
MLVGVALQTAAQNIGMFIGARFIIGFGLTFACAAAPLLITELSFPTHRGPLTSLYNSSWYLGSIVAAWSTYGTFRIGNDWSWRIPSLLQGLPSILQVALILFIPESPRWLMDKGREEQARAILVKYHCNGDHEDPLVAYEVDEIRMALQLEREANSSSSFKSLFVGKGNRRRMLVIIAIAFFSQWSGNGLVSYYLNSVLNGIGIKDTETQTLINGILNIFNYATAIFGALTVDRIGRRPLFLISTAGMCVCFSIWTACSAIYTKSAAEVDADENPIHPNKSAGRAVLAMIFLFYMFYNLAMSPLLVAYTVEM